MHFLSPVLHFHGIFRSPVLHFNRYLLILASRGSQRNRMLSEGAAIVGRGRSVGSRDLGLASLPLSLPPSSFFPLLGLGRGELSPSLSLLFTLCVLCFLFAQISFLCPGNCPACGVVHRKQAFKDAKTRSGLLTVTGR